jgi:rieske iron-sulfur protein
MFGQLGYDGVHTMSTRDCVGRRRLLLQAGLAAGVGALLSPQALVGAQEAAAAVRPKPGDLLVRADDSEHRPLRPADIPLNARQMAAWAMDPDGTVRSGSRFNALILLRLDDASLTATTRARAAEGVLAYTAICTHEGCDVDAWIEERRVLLCACHESEFDPKDAAKVLAGPAPRVLPALPLKIVDGTLVVARPFTSRVGFEQG